MSTVKRVSTPIPDSVVALWHPTKNLPLLPENLSAGSTKRIIHWICQRKHEWTGNVLNEIKRNGCKECQQFIIKTDGTNLATRYPELVPDWHPTANGELTPFMISAGSKKKVWWLGSCSHEWEMGVQHRTHLNQGCPYCAGTKVLVGFNDLATTNPAIAADWHPCKNGDLTPRDVSKGSNKKVWWLGKCGHEWETGVIARGAKGNGCPYCSGTYVLSGFNDVATRRPELVKEWDEEKNDTSPSEYTYGSKVKVWWKCVKNHSWLASICDRPKYGCPDCAKENAGVTKSIPKNGSDLSTFNPEMAKEWHPTKNGNLTPRDVNGGSKARIWWQCEEGHEWEAKISDRRFYKTKCPVCALNISISRGHQAIYDFLVENGLSVINNDRTVLSGKEIDMYVPEKNIGIEFNGTYWHTEDTGKDKYYHYDKWEAAMHKGIQLIQIWGDEWNRNPELIKNMLLHKMGLTSQRKIFARNTKPCILSKQEAEAFLLKNHIQGYASGKYYFGLRETTGANELVSVIVLKQEADDVLNIVRYATSANVIGGFTKLISYAKKVNQPSRFVTFSDNCVSDGSLYRNNGFVVDKELEPDYRYVVRDVRVHKFGYRLKRFREDPNLIWQDGLSETELAKLNGIPRIWDAGKTRWVLDVEIA